VRHGETTWNQQRVIQGGGSDTDLSETGRDQAEKLGLLLKDTLLTAVYASPLKRAMDTAHAIAKHHGLKVHAAHGLKEVAVGELEGVSLDKFAQSFSQFMVDWQTKGDQMTFFGGENLGDFRDRVWKAILEIVDKNKDGTVVVVSHFFVTATVVCQAPGLPITHLVRIRIQPSSRTILEFSNGYPPRLLLLSDICHLREG